MSELRARRAVSTRRARPPASTTSGPTASATGSTALCASLDRDAQLNELGDAARPRHASSDRCRTGCGSSTGSPHHPEVADERIEAPIVVIGMFRAGTTLLSHLLDQDARNRALLMWEARRQRPAARARRAPHRAARRRGPRRQRHARADQPEDRGRAPRGGRRADRVHHGDGAGLQEPHVGGHRQRARRTTSGCSAVDQRSAYEYHRAVLQVLQSGGVRGRWTLKSPHHAHRARAPHRGVPRRPPRAAAPRPGGAHRVGVQPHHHAVVDVHRRRPPRLHRRALDGDARGRRSVASTRSATPTRSTRSSTCSTPTSWPIRSARCGDLRRVR